MIRVELQSSYLEKPYLTSGYFSTLISHIFKNTHAQIPEVFLQSGEAAAHMHNMWRGWLSRTTVTSSYKRYIIVGLDGHVLLDHVCSWFLRCTNWITLSSTLIANTMTLLQISSLIMPATSPYIAFQSSIQPVPLTLTPAPQKGALRSSLSCTRSRSFLSTDSCSCGKTRSQTSWNFVRSTSSAITRPSHWTVWMCAYDRGLIHHEGFSRSVSKVWLEARHTCQPNTIYYCTQIGSSLLRSLFLKQIFNHCYKVIICSVVVTISMHMAWTIGYYVVIR